MSSRLAKTRRLPASTSNGCDVIASLPHSSPDNRDLGPENDFMAPPIIRFAFELIPCPKVGLTSLGQPRLSEAAQPYPDALVALPTANRLPPPPDLNKKGRRTAPSHLPRALRPSCPRVRSSGPPVLGSSCEALVPSSYLAGISFSVYQPSLCQSVSPDLALMSPSTRW